MRGISAIIIARDEQENIARAIKSLEGLGEVLVLDSGSRDRTPEIAQALGARVVRTDWPGYAAQRRRGLGLAAMPWALFLDADELLNAELRVVLCRQNLGGPARGYFIRRINYFLGRQIRHARWGNDWQMRLVRRDSASVPQVDIHEGIVVDGPTVRLEGGAIDHYTVPSLYRYLEKMNAYTTLEAGQKLSQGHRFSWGRLIWEPLAEIWKLFVALQGWREGVRGLAISLLSALGRFVVTAKMRETGRG